MRDAFAVLFFVSVGMLFDWQGLVESPTLVLAALAIILLGKPLAAFSLVILMRYPLRVALSVASQRYPFCAKAFVEYLHLLEEPRIQVSFKEMEMAAVIDEVARRQSALGILFLSDATEHFIARLLREKGLTFHPLVNIRPRVFLRKGHPLAGEKSVRPEQLYEYPYVVFTQSDSNYHFAEEAVAGTVSSFDRVITVSDRATAYNVMAHTDSVSTGSGVLPDGYGDDRLMTLPLVGDVADMRLGVIRPKDVPLTGYGEKFAAILKDLVSKLNQEA